MNDKRHRAPRLPGVGIGIVIMIMGFVLAGFISSDKTKPEFEKNSELYGEIFPEVPFTSFSDGLKGIYSSYEKSEGFSVVANDKTILSKGNSKPDLRVTGKIKTNGESVGLYQQATFRANIGESYVLSVPDGNKPEIRFFIGPGKEDSFSIRSLLGSLVLILFLFSGLREIVTSLWWTSQNKRAMLHMKRTERWAEQVMEND